MIIDRIHKTQHNTNMKKHNPFMPNILFYLHSLDRSNYQYKGCQYLLWPCFIEIRVFDPNTGDAYQTPRSVASDQGLHCLLMSSNGTLGLNGLKSRSEQPQVHTRNNRHQNHRLKTANSKTYRGRGGGEDSLLNQSQKRKCKLNSIIYK